MVSWGQIGGEGPPTRFKSPGKRSEKSKRFSKEKGQTRMFSNMNQSYFLSYLGYMLNTGN